MQLQSGARLGPYEIQDAIGAGGMGEVYRARDTRLNRTVAIKILVADVASDPQFRERFDREARTISALDHPHVCALYDVGQHGDTAYLVMQFIDGETLADRLARVKALALPDALAIAVQIADALDAAHRRGIVHRDLKPGNIMLTKTGVKLLDFGLAKPLAEPVAMTTLADTKPRPLTAHGMLLGTMSYMAPEQVEGREADVRSDVWAFGCVVYEMLTGTPPFSGQSPASVIGSILRDVPTPISRTATLSPPALDRAVAKALAKDPDQRWQSIADLRDELRWIGEQNSTAVIAANPSRQSVGRRAMLPLALTLLVAVLALAAFAWSRRQPPPAIAPMARFSIALPSDVAFQGSPTVSPDGLRVVFVARQSGRDALWVRAIDDLQSRRLDGTEDASLPFWSPDSRSIGFFANGHLKRIDAAGGTPRTLCDAPTGRGGTWSRDGVIVFAAEVLAPLLQVPANGGPVTPATRLDQQRQDNSHRFPHFLPDGRKFLFTGRTGDVKTTGTYFASLDDPTAHFLVSADSGAVYADGYLLFARENTLFAQAFDSERMQVTGNAVSLVEPIGYDFARTRGYFSASNTGVLAYYPGGGTWTSTGTFRLIWYNRAGRMEGTVGETGLQFNPTLSPDGKSLLFDRLDGRTGARTVWLGDLERGVVSRVSFGDSFATAPLWSRDGSAFLFLSVQRAGRMLLLKPAGGGASEKTFAEGSMLGTPTSWSPDGRQLLFQRVGEQTRTDIWMLPLDGAREPVPYLTTPFDETQAQFSPDGRWVAYASDESGQYEVYVRNYPAGDLKIRVSSAGGGQPQWRGDGRELFYFSLDQSVMAVSVMPQGASLSARAPQRLFSVDLAVSIPRERNGFVPDPTGQRFLVSASREQFDKPLIVMQNWRAALPN